MNQPIIWTIAGSDSSGGAGIQADLLTFQQLGIQACSVITAVTSQNHRQLLSMYSLPPTEVMSQIVALQSMQPKAIKIGMLGQLSTIDIMLTYLQQYSGKVVLDPVLATTTGYSLFDVSLPQYVQGLRSLFPYIDLLTSNIPEAELLLNRRIRSSGEIKQAASALLALGVKQVVIKGGHTPDDPFSQDYWTDGQQSCWVAIPRYPTKNYRGSGCVFSSAMTACLALGYSMKDALVIAKMYVSQGIRLAKQDTTTIGLLTHAGWPIEQIDLPYLSDTALTQVPVPFEMCLKNQFGLYPIVDSSDWIEMLLAVGITLIQLRIKNQSMSILKREIQRSIQLAKKGGAILFINDHWELAILYGAYGVHLGQEDLRDADIKQIRAAKLRLGISTHCYEEVARAHTYHPSYIACGPIFPTTSKQMNFPPHGLQQLQRWRSILSDYPLVAIGGINKDNMTEVKKTGVQGIALISAITKAIYPRREVLELLNMMNL